MNEEQVQQELNKILEATSKNVSRIARLINDEEVALSKLQDDEVKENVSLTRIRMAEAIQTGSYDDFAFCMSILCHAGVIKGGRDKWKQLPMITDFVWRECRDTLKSEIANAVDQLINDIQEG